LSNVEIRLLGQMAATSAANGPIEINGKKSWALLACLALSPNQSITREKLTGLLWQDRGKDQAQASLRQALSVLKKAFSAVDSEIIISDRMKISINLENLIIDAVAIEEGVTATELADLAKVAAYYRGTLLDGLVLNESEFSYWLQFEQERIDVLYTTVLDKIVDLEQQRGNYKGAIHRLNEKLKVDSSDESVHRRIMTCHAQMGNIALASRHFSNCSKILKTEYDVAPSSETIALHDKIKLQGATSSLKDDEPELLDRQQNESSVIPTLCAMPFRTVGNDVEAERLSNELTQESLGAISRFRWISVLPSSRTFRTRHDKENSIDVARNIGARFVFEGIAQRRLDSFSVSLEIIDADRERLVWRQNFSCELESHGTFPPQFVSQMVAQIEMRLRVYQTRESIDEPGSKFGALENSLLGLHCVNNLNRESFIKAQDYFDRAQELGPNFAPALARKAFQIDPEDAIALAIAGHAESFIHHQFDQAFDLFERAENANPHSSFVWMLSSATFAYFGDHKEAIRRLSLAARICESEAHYRFMYNSAHCIAYSFARDHETAASWGRRTVRENPYFTNGIKQLLVNLGHLGHRDEATSHVDQLLKLEPGFTCSKFRVAYPFKLEKDRIHFSEGLYKAGVPR